ncbi:MAG: type 2 isopentenyl-diphosphate Delta-isomerase [Deltaproteobacteria bacterium]
MDDSGIPRRKSEHLAIVSAGRAAFRGKTTLLEEVELVHEALPELSLGEVDLSSELLGRRLSAPILVGAMTGGTPEAERINRDLARAAEAEGVGLCLGSQRAMLRDPKLRSTYAVRDVAPSALLVGNLGLVQARELGAEGLDRLRQDVGADAIFIHLNPAMELVQAGGDRDFRGGEAALAALVGRLGERLWVKETGAGLSWRTARALARAGVRTVETAGAGGTSWVAVELERAGADPAGAPFREWGIPTAASVAFCVARGLTTFAGGGLRTGLDLARAIALGASGGAFAAPLLLAQRDGGVEGVRAALRRLSNELRLALALTGCRRLDELRQAPRIVGPSLERWLRAGAPSAG